MKFNFRRKRMELRRSCYKSNQDALIAVNLATNEQFILTIDVPTYNLPSGEFAIKAWNAGKDLAEVVYNTGLFEDTRKRGTSEDGIIEFWIMRKPHKLTDIPPVT